MKETDIQKAICDYLAYKHYFFWRQNTSAILNHATGKFKSMPKYSLNGIPDIILIKDGQFIGLEVKMPKGVQSEHQKTFEKFCIRAGGKYHLVKSIEDVIKIGL